MRGDRDRSPIYEHHSDFHRIRVTENNGVRSLRFRRNQQSSMHVDDPFETDIEYVRYLHLPIAVKPDASSALVIGLGGGSLVKRMWRDYPEMRIDAVELDPEVVQVARAYFALPDDERLNVVAGDGRAYVEASSACYDVVVIDAFDEDAVPLRLSTEEFMRSVRERMSPDGAVAYNFIGSVYGRHSKPFRSLHRTATNVWRSVWTFPVGISADPGDVTRNIVLLASDTPLSHEELRSRIQDRAGGRVTVRDFESCADDLYRGPVRDGDVALNLDPPTGRPPRQGSRRNRR